MWRADWVLEKLPGNWELVGGQGGKRFLGEGGRLERWLELVFGRCLWLFAMAGRAVARIGIRASCRGGGCLLLAGGWRVERERFRVSAARGMRWLDGVAAVQLDVDLARRIGCNVFGVAERPFREAGFPKTLYSQGKTDLKPNIRNIIGRYRWEIGVGFWGCLRREPLGLLAERRKPSGDRGGKSSSSSCRDIPEALRPAARISRRRDASPLGVLLSHPGSVIPRRNPGRRRKIGRRTRRRKCRRIAVVRNAA